MISHQMRLCKKICIRALLDCPLNKLHHTLTPLHSLTPALPFIKCQTKSTLTQPPLNTQLPRQFLQRQSKCHYNERDNILKTLIPLAESVKYDVVMKDGVCKSCNKNFYNMGCISPETFRQFIEFQLGRPEHLERGYGFLKTIPLEQIKSLLRKQLLVVEKLVRTIPQSQGVIAVVDQVNIKNMQHEHELEWLSQNRDKIVEITEFFAPHMFRVKAYDGASKKTYAVKCKYFYKGLDDLYCVYVSLLFPQMPTVFSHDHFTNYIARANEFETASGEKDFGVNFEKILSNVSSPRIPSGGRHGFYFPSSCYTSHHVIEKGRSYCITTTQLEEGLSAVRHSK